MIWVRWGAAMMFSGVALGAFGAHGLRTRLSSEMLEIYKTGVMYHLIHALGLFVVAWLSTRSEDGRVNLAGACLVAGILLFSGSLYTLSITGIRWLGAITPIGGALFLTAWFMIGMLAKRPS